MHDDYKATHIQLHNVLVFLHLGNNDRSFGIGHGILHIQIFDAKHQKISISYSDVYTCSFMSCKYHDIALVYLVLMDTFLGSTLPLRKNPV